MESVLIDQSPLNPRKSFGVNNSSGYGGFMTRPSSISSVSQIFLNRNAGAGAGTGTGTGSGKARFGLFGSRPPPPRHFSLPSFSVTPAVVSPPPPFPPPTPPLHQPPLLPLPFAKSATLPSPTPTKRIAAAVTTARSRDHRKKTRPVANPARKDPRSPATSAAPSDPPKGESVSSAVPHKPPQKPASPPAAKAEWEEEVEEGAEAAFAMESVYSLSPPPSSLPLPTFFLKRPKAAAAAASCIAEAMGCGGGGGGSVGARVNAGATDDLRRLLRL